MALIHCPECGREISDRVKACPHCGYPMEESAARPAVRKKKRGGLAVVLVLVLAAAVCAGLFAFRSQTQAKARAEYIATLKKTHSDMLHSAADAESLCNLTYAVWRDTIYKDYHIETSPFTQVNGRYRSDFNDALAALYSDEETRAKVASLKGDQNDIASAMRKLQSPPKGLETCFETITEQYEAYTVFTELAVSPSGSLKTYSEKFQSADSDFMTLYNSLSTQIPEE